MKKYKNTITGMSICETADPLRYFSWTEVSRVNPCEERKKENILWSKVLEIEMLHWWWSSGEWTDWLRWQSLLMRGKVCQTAGSKAKLFQRDIKGWFSEISIWVHSSKAVQGNLTMSSSPVDWRAQILWMSRTIICVVKKNPCTIAQP